MSPFFLLRALSCFSPCDIDSFFAKNGALIIYIPVMSDLSLRRFFLLEADPFPSVKWAVTQAFMRERIKPTC